MPASFALFSGFSRSSTVPFGNLRKRFVSRREDGERPLALQRFHQVGGLQRGGERLEAAGRYRRVHNVLRQDHGVNDVDHAVART